ncbi:hypothetical protein M0802_008508 [Mischocyttarus mexicanus]|nr:hypothetical protein M0802_008508 [Mischocyttarus mexicanus]
MRIGKNMFEKVYSKGVLAFWKHEIFESVDERSSPQRVPPYMVGPTNVRGRTDVRVQKYKVSFHIELLI